MDDNKIITVFIILIDNIIRIKIIYFLIIYILKMTFPISAIFIIAVLGFSTYLIYSQNQATVVSSQVVNTVPSKECPNCAKKVEVFDPQMQPFQPQPLQMQPFQMPPVQLPPVLNNVTVQQKDDRYADSIKKQDKYMMYDPLTYPQLRLPREVLDRYNEYYEKTGVYPPFNQATQPQLFDNPILNGFLVKLGEDNEPYNENIPSAVPLIRVKSVKNANRYFYYIVDQRYLSKLELKIPLDHVKVNGVRYTNSDFYGIPELFDGDIITDIPIYPEAKFKVSLYKTYHFP